MTDSDSNAAVRGPSPSADSPQYVVVARRYRPQAFDELIGQEHVAKALSGAIETGRVGHAYLFTGARGVGKTSAARILAKALNCQQGTSPVPCNVCDICQSVSSGDDVDVLEIDGASNRGIDEIRQLRQNVNVRPSRARFKIYIIDEVHMLTREAFNALLKTLEEPPEHVKFIFCTTEPTKIPITILSRCQRFDFAGILASSIATRLRQIVDAEGVEAEPEALEVLARRAAGSMRDSQSLLEQLLAFAPERITLDDVHGMLGTAGDHRMAALVGHLLGRDAAAALADLDAAAGEGVDVALLLEQLLGYFRDCMAAAVDCPPESYLFASPAARDDVTAAGKQLGLATVLAAMQILDQALSRMRQSTQSRILAELALVRICHLENLEELSEVIARLPAEGGPTASPTRPAPAAALRQRPIPRQTAAVEVPPVADTASAEAGPPEAGASAAGAVELDDHTAIQVWTQALSTMSGMVVEQAKEFDRVTVAAPNRLVIHFKPKYAVVKSSCERPETLARFEQALAEVSGQRIRLSFAVDEHAAAAETAPTSGQRRAAPHQRLLEVVDHPMIRRAGELFGAQPTRVDDPPKRD